MFIPSAIPLIDEETIRGRVDDLALRIAGDYPDPITVIGLLRGSFVFIADLIRALHRHGAEVEEVDFLIVSSYGSGTESSGNVKVERDVRHDIAGRHVLLVDDILDSGNTLARILELFRRRNPATLRTAVLLDKPERRTVSFEADYVGFAIENHFVVGYGLDYDQRYRQLPYVTIVEERPDAS